MPPVNILAKVRPISNIFAEVKAEVPSLQAYRLYAGQDLKRTGARWMARCPFHDDRSPSLVFYPDGGWYCFGCGAGGDSVDFVARLFNLRPLEAAQKLAEDFHLPLPTRPKDREELRLEAKRRQEEERAVAAFRARVRAAYDELAEVHRLAKVALRCARDPFGFPMLIRYISLLEYWLDELLTGDAERQLLAINSAQEEGLLAWPA
jgi:hypothetical protein